MRTPVKSPRVALITGAARRIGGEIARVLAAEGWHVGVHYGSSRDDAEQVVGEILSLGGTAAALAADLSSPADVAGLIPACTAELGAPTCLVNNASLFLDDRIETLDVARWDAHLDINLRAPVLLAQAFARQLPAGAAGNIINIVDQRVLRPTPEFFSYAVSKAGLWSATRMLAQAFAPRIRVNAVGPGPVLKSIHQTDEEFARESGTTLLGRGTTPGEIAAAVRFILDAPAMTGQMIVLDGGQHLAWDVVPSSPTS